MKDKNFRKYFENEVLSSPKERLVVLIYDKLLKTLNLASSYIEKKDIAATHEQLIKSQEIIYVLLNHLNMEAGDISKNLYQLYEFSLRKLKQANIKKDNVKDVKDVINIFRELKSAWEKAISGDTKEEISKDNKRISYSV